MMRRRQDRRKRNERRRTDVSVMPYNAPAVNVSALVVSAHALFRYCERVLGMQPTPGARKYAHAELHRMLEHAIPVPHRGRHSSSQDVAGQTFRLRNCVVFTRNGVVTTVLESARFDSTQLHALKEPRRRKQA